MHELIDTLIHEHIDTLVHDKVSKAKTMNIYFVSPTAKIQDFLCFAKGCTLAQSPKNA